ncbi:MAG: NrsF family protein [Deltaproteobacteria bacterium]|nr:NrsF family protein [Deltaproteobacteria bacterium]
MSKNPVGFVGAKDLILRQLADDRRLRWRLFPLIVAALVLLAHAPRLIGKYRADIPINFSSWTYWADDLLFVALVTAATALLLGRPLIRRTWLTALVVIFASLLHWPFFHAGQPEEFSTDVFAAGWGCFATGLIFVVLAIAAFFPARNVMRRSFAARVMFGVAAGAVGVSALYHHCGYDGIYHLLCMHGGLLLPAVGLGFSCSGPAVPPNKTRFPH